MSKSKGLRVRAFPVWQLARGPDEKVQAAEHPQTGKWWFRWSQCREVFLYGQRRRVYAFGPWECPDVQPENPVQGMMKRPRAAMLPVA